MQTVIITIPRQDVYIGSDSFEVFGDRGTGSIDYDHPLTPHPVPFWPDAPARSGHLLDAHLILPHLDSVTRAGHLQGSHLVGGHLQPELGLAFETEPYIFGLFKHAVRTRDAAGNVSETPPAELATTINSAPRAPHNFVKTAYDPATDQLTFSFRPSALGR